MKVKVVPFMWWWVVVVFRGPPKRTLSIARSLRWMLYVVNISVVCSKRYSLVVPFISLLMPTILSVCITLFMPVHNLVLFHVCQVRLWQFHTTIFDCYIVPWEFIEKFITIQLIAEHFLFRESAVNYTFVQKWLCYFQWIFLKIDMKIDFLDLIYL